MTLVRILPATLLLCSLAVGKGCARSNENQKLTIFAAASLTEVFEALAEDFERAHPSVDVQLSFAGSQSLRLQIEDGAQADLFASADVRHLSALETQSIAEPAHVFASNELVVALPIDNPASIAHFSELGQAKRIVIAGAQVPAGHYTDRMLKRTVAIWGPEFRDSVLANVVSRENHVRATLQKVQLGEADAAIVYRTDARSVSKTVDTIEIPARVNVRGEYGISVLTGRRNRRAAQRFVEWLSSVEGARRLEAFGFERTSDRVSALRD